MLSGFENSPYIINQYKVSVPICMIYMEEEIRKVVKEKLKKDGITLDGSTEKRQKYVDLYFQAHKDTTGEEHEANTVKNDNELWKMYMKHKYDHTRRIVHRREDLAYDIWDDPDHNQYYGAKIKPYYDKNHVLDIESSEVCLYRVDPFMNDDRRGLTREYLGFDDIDKLHEIISLIRKENSMPRENVFYKGKYAAFSTITDSFITQFRDKDSFESWRKIEYGINCVNIEETTIISIDDAISSIHLNRNFDETVECLKDAGISSDEAKGLVDKFEIDHYRPIKDNDDKYKCPNCGAPVTLGQEQCIDTTCQLKFVWKGIK